MKLASFDIFDTTLIRKCGRPENVFYLLSKKLFPGDEACQTDFFMWRINAERNMRGKLNKRIVTLEEIYTDFDTLGFSSVLKQDAIKAEMEMESSQLTSNCEIKNVIEEKRSEGFVICFISDMYLSQSFLKEILIREECAVENDSIFISCEFGASKETGDLYDVVKQTIGDVSEWTHYGDNVKSDYKQSKKKGITSILVDTNYTANELIIENKYRQYSLGYELSILIGFQRCGRLHLANHSDDFENAADYIASAYIPYLCFIFQHALKKGINRLYFLYRDSHVLYKMSNVMKHFYPDIECRPLYGSRKSLFLPTLDSITPENICSVIGGKQSLVGKSVDEILNLLHLNKSQIQVSFNTISTVEEQEELMRQILVHREFVEHEHNRCKELLNAYFEQEGLYDDSTKAIVDVGWYGSTRMMINKNLRERGCQNIPFFYYCCRKDVLGKENGTYYSFLPYSFHDGQKTLLIEAYYSLCDVPSTIGYSMEKHKVVPLFKEKSPKEEVKDLTKINIQVNQIILSYILETIKFMDYAEAFSLWGVAFCNMLFECPKNIRYSTFMKLENYDSNNTIIKTVSFKELIFYIRKGYLPSLCLQNNSICYTYGIDAIAMKKQIRRIVKLLVK